MNENFLKKADALKPELISDIVEAKNIVEIADAQKQYIVQVLKSFSQIQTNPMGKGDKICLDFGKHCVGYFSFEIRSIGNPPDNPAHLKIKFGETPCEIAEPFSEYHGNISSSWLQEEYLFVDELPCKIDMPRRYAFRYVEIEVLDTSFQFKVIIENVKCRTVSSADRRKLGKCDCHDLKLTKIDEVAINTLEGCMQDVFEDGPKRDRRLWIGDFRLEALTNYETFKNYNLVKRCLYLFAAEVLPNGKIGGCLYTKPTLIVDTAIHLFDYSLFFVSCLYDYYCATGDLNTLQDLWETAYQQLIIAEKDLDDNGVVMDHPDDWWWCFVDWNVDLNKQASAQAIYIYVLKQGLYLAEEMNLWMQKKRIESLINRTAEAAEKFLWDASQHFFVSGKERQISWASQVWFILAGILSPDEEKDLIQRVRVTNPEIKMVTPYMNHFYIEALIKTGLQKEAISYLKKYWGGMVDAGADCFWEVYEMDQPELSAYGDRIINSYCHAWSCTPSYFIRNNFKK